MERTPFLAMTILAGMLLPGAVQAGIILSEVLYDSSGSDNGNVFVELFGTPGTVLDNLLLEGINGTDGTVYRSITLAGMIPTDGVFVVGDDSGDGTTLVANTDLVAEVDLQNGPDSVVLRDPTGVLDALGYGDFTTAVFAGEGSPAADATPGNSLARLNPLLDTDNNLADFVSLSTPTPGTVPVGVVPLPPALLLFLSGVAGLISVSRKRA
jgi:hypothetical protein